MNDQSFLTLFRNKLDRLQITLSQIKEGHPMSKKEVAQFHQEVTNLSHDCMIAQSINQCIVLEYVCQALNPNKNNI